MILPALIVNLLMNIKWSKWTRWILKTLFN